MPRTKNALERVRVLDKLLSENVKRRYSVKKLLDLYNEELIQAGVGAVTRRCLEKDLEWLKENGVKVRSDKEGKNTIHSYEHSDDCFFNQKMSTSEKKVLSAFLTTFGKIQGLENFNFFENLKSDYELDGVPAISFSVNPDIANSEYLPKLFEAINGKKVLKIKIHKLDNSEKKQEYEVCPYLLKQYNNRWFLICEGVQRKGVLQFSLEQIDDISKATKSEYKECSESLEEYFDDVVGVSKPKGAKPEKIIFWASDKAKMYLRGKPIHGTQKELKDQRQLNELRKNYNLRRDGSVFELRCLVNYELERELSSFFEGIVVLEPLSLRKKLLDKFVNTSLAYGLNLLESQS